MFDKSPGLELLPKMENLGSNLAGHVALLWHYSLIIILLPSSNTQHSMLDCVARHRQLVQSVSGLCRSSSHLASERGLAFWASWCLYSESWLLAVSPVATWG